MITKKLMFFDPFEIADSGQCFRWRKLDENKVCLVAFDRYLTIEKNGDSFDFSCDEEEWENVWSEYFDCGTDYAKISVLIEKSNDAHLMEAFLLGSGIRILKQDLWEIIISFLISQNNNIGRIKKSIDAFCRACGQKLDNGEYCFPKPCEVPMSVFEDSSFGFGYRAPFLKEMYEYACKHPEFPDNLRGLSYIEAREALLKHKGIGPKVADCISLFGLHHIEAFPIDTHVKQLLAKYYCEGFNYEYFDGYAGIIQQYLFNYEIRK